MKVDMDLERRARHRDKTDVFAEESEALDQIAKQVRKDIINFISISPENQSIIQFVKALTLK